MKAMLTMIALLAALLILSFCTGNKADKEDNKQMVSDESVMTNEELVAKGEYLVTLAGCNDCHSPKRMGERGPEIIPETMLSGFPADRPVAKIEKAAVKNGWSLFNEDLTQSSGPWGISFAANLTSDPSGIGNWTEEQFRKALTQGKFKGLDGGRMLLPPMPWQNYTNLKEEDVKAIFAYLKSTRPVRNVVPPPIPPDELK